MKIKKKIFSKKPSNNKEKEKEKIILNIQPLREKNC